MSRDNAIKSFDNTLGDLKDLFGNGFDELSATIRPILVDKAAQIEAQMPSAIGGDPISKANIKHLIGQASGEIGAAALHQTYHTKRLLGGIAAGVLRAAFAAALA